MTRTLRIALLFFALVWLWCFYQFAQVADAYGCGYVPRDDLRRVLVVADLAPLYVVKCPTYRAIKAVQWAQVIV